MSLSLGPLVGSLLSPAISQGIGVLGGVAAIETAIYANKYVFLPVVEKGVSLLYGALGENPLQTQQEIEYLNNTYFNPLFEYTENFNSTVKNLIEDAVGKDLDGNGTIGKTGNTETSKGQLNEIGQCPDRDNQESGSF